MMNIAILVACLSVLHVSAQSLKQSRVETWHDASERWEDDDLMRFITRPDIRPPKWRIVQHKKDLTEPGYFFLAPYASFNRPYANSMWMPHQVGPHIYDKDGELVWSGGHIYPGRAAFDFKTATYKDHPHLTFAIGMGPTHTMASQGIRMVLNSSYHIAANYTPSDGIHENLHEFTVLDNGHSALCVEHSTAGTMNVTSNSNEGNVLLTDQSVVELNLQTGKKIFDWKAHQHIDPAESSVERPMAGDANSAAMGQSYWDYLHLNSIDKSPDGNYLISARHTDTIYYISGSSGNILWKLGGINSSFQMEGFDFSQDFRFSRQHDARIRSQNRTTTIISLFNNACDEETLLDDDEPSSLLDLALYTAQSPMIAKVIRRIPRPDRRRTFARGNYQYLPGGNVLGGWGDDGYVTEHTPSGEVVYEASFASSRFTVYRTYKRPWVGQPLDEPIVKAFASTTRHGELTTIFYVSWNGATEVRRWNLYSADHGISDVRRLGGTLKTGFETSFIVKGHYAIVFAEAIDKDDFSLANSTLARTELPKSWHIEDFDEDEERLEENSSARRTKASGDGMLRLGLIVLAVVLLLFIKRVALQRVIRRITILLSRGRRCEECDEGSSHATQGKTNSVARGGSVLQR